MEGMQNPLTISPIDCLGTTRAVKKNVAILFDRKASGSLGQTGPPGRVKLVSSRKRNTKMTATASSPTLYQYCTVQDAYETMKPERVAGITVLAVNQPSRILNLDLKQMTHPNKIITL